MSFSIAICDDESNWIEQIRKMIELYSLTSNHPMEIIEFGSGEDILKEYSEGNFPEIDLLLLDIEMPGVSGLEVKDRLSHEKRIKRIVFTTSHAEAMQEAFGVKVMGFLVKPVRKDELFKTIRRVEVELSRIETVTYENGAEKGVLLSMELKYIESQADITVLHFTDESSRPKEEIRQRLHYWLRRLPESKFVRVHKSFIVNMDYIDDAEHGEIRMDGDDTVLTTIGRTYKSAFRKKYDEYLLEAMEGRI